MQWIPASVEDNFTIAVAENDFITKQNTFQGR